jgi:mono/diheme cytochrome c family protein
VSWCLWAKAVGASSPQAQTAGARTGEEIYRAACATCHGADGRGNPKSHVGFNQALPDFTDCGFATPEADADWFGIVHSGGPVRAFARQMPAFGEALSGDEIVRVVAHLRTFCADARWPRGDLNQPRPLVTEKAFPENEALLETSASRTGGIAVGNTFIYERRLGARSQWELAVPIDLRQNGTGGAWGRGAGDIAAALKHVLFHDVNRGSIFSAGAEIAFPTGKAAAGFGKGVTIVEPFVSAGQLVGSSGFVQAQAGVELPTNRVKAPREAFWRIAAGRTFFQDRFHREWSPMMEVVAARELARGKPTQWDVVPQMQVSLSRRHHVLVNGGFQLPVSDRAGRARTFRMYVLWDWFDGGLFDGW